MKKPKAQKCHAIFLRTLNKKAALFRGHDVDLGFGVRKICLNPIYFTYWDVTGHLLSLKLNFCICKMEIELQPQRSVRIHTCLIYTNAQQRCFFHQPLPKTRTQMSRFLNQVCYFPLHQPWDYNHVLMNDGRYLMYVLVEGGWWTRNTYELLFLIGLYGLKLYLLITNGL